MRALPWLMALLLSLFAAACGDLSTGPTAPERAAVPTDRVLTTCYWAGTGEVRCGESSPDWTCDPYVELDWCKGDDCAMSAPGMDDPEHVSTTGCNDTGTPPPPNGGYHPPPPSDPDCNPQYDPDCNKPLTSADSTTLKSGFQKHINTQFTDPAKAAQCKQLKDEFDRLMASGNVYRGAYDTPQNDPHTAVHVGAYDPVSGTMHFEPSALDDANAGNPDATRNIVNTALHEAAHALGYNHSDPIWMGSYDLYAEPPFDLLSPGTNSCITGW